MGNNNSNSRNLSKRVSNFGNIVPITKECVNEPMELEFRNYILGRTIPVNFNSLPQNSTINISLDYTPLSKPTSTATIFELVGEPELKLFIKNGFFYFKVGNITTNISRFTMGNTSGKAVSGTKNQGQTITLNPPVPFVKFNFEIRLFPDGEFTRPKLMTVVTATSRELDKTYFIDVTTKDISETTDIANYNSITFGKDIVGAIIENVCISAETKEDQKTPVEITDFRIVDEIGNITDPLIMSSIVN